MVCTGNDHFILDGKEIEMTMTDFFQWFNQDFTDSSRRSVLSKFIVSSSLGLSDSRSKDSRNVRFHREYDFLTQDGYRVQIESASYLQSDDGKNPSHISFAISSWDVDVYIFCLYKATSLSQNPLDLNLWDFFVLPSSTLPDRKLQAITLPRLTEIGVWQCDFYGIAAGIEKAMDV